MPAQMQGGPGDGGGEHSQSQANSHRQRPPGSEKLNWSWR
jgi:hypothetical protein